MKTEAIVFAPARSRTLDFLALAKPRLNVLVVLSTAVAFYLGAGESVDPVILLNTIVGTALVAAGASALNQVYERDVDGLMQRTRLRPLPDGRVLPNEGRFFGYATASAGLLWLSIGANVLAAIVALVTVVFYAAIYTPLKRRTPLSTVLGAIPGALPPVIGWAAAQHAVPLQAWVLFAIVFLWQIPHFFAIVWMYRDDYARAGFPLLPVIEPDGRSTARQVMLYGTALLPVSVAPALVGIAGTPYAIGAAALSTAFLVLSARFAWQRDQTTARWLFIGSIVYLPLLWGLMVANRLPGGTL